MTESATDAKLQIKYRVHHEDLWEAYNQSKMLMRHLAADEEAERPPSPLRIGVLMAIVVLYCKPFSNNDFARLDLQGGEDWLAFTDPEHIRLHDYLRKLRDKMVAHSDKELRRPEVGQGLYVQRVEHLHPCVLPTVVAMCDHLCRGLRRWLQARDERPNIISHEWFKGWDADGDKVIERRAIPFADGSIYGA